MTESNIDLLSSECEITGKYASSYREQPSLSSSSLLLLKSSSFFSSAWSTITMPSSGFTSSILNSSIRFGVLRDSSNILSRSRMSLGNMSTAGAGGVQGGEMSVSGTGELPDGDTVTSVSIAGMEFNGDVKTCMVGEECAGASTDLREYA